MGRVAEDFDAAGAEAGAREGVVTGAVGLIGNRQGLWGLEIGGTGVKWRHKIGEGETRKNMGRTCALALILLCFPTVSHSSSTTEMDGKINTVKER